jgi:hypothetical protein
MASTSPIDAAMSSQHEHDHAHFILSCSAPPITTAAETADPSSSGNAENSTSLNHQKSHNNSQAETSPIAQFGGRRPDPGNPRTDRIPDEIMLPGQDRDAQESKRATGLSRICDETLIVNQTAAAMPNLTQKDSCVDLPVATTKRTKSGRTFYIRFFPGRLYLLYDRLNDRDFKPFLRLSQEFVSSNGQLPCGDNHLASVTKLSLKNWMTLKDKLLKFGLGNIENDLWIDEDQKVNLDIQRGAIIRGSAGGKQAAANRKQNHEK